MAKKGIHKDNNHSSLRDTGCLPCAKAHGKGPDTHGKVFAVCNTRQIAHGIDRPANRTFAVCPLSGTRQTLCRVSFPVHGKCSTLPSALASTRQSNCLPCVATLSCASMAAHGKKGLCRVPDFEHTAKLLHTAKALFAVCQLRHSAN